MGGNGGNMGGEWPENGWKWLDPGMAGTWKAGSRYGWPVVSWIQVWLARGKLDPGMAGRR